ncbi:MAG: hypothetical protein HQM01_01645 [Magnetococcales bacterium]|nr:hypothetical protein [Magnetococcales bacterium]
MAIPFPLVLEEMFDLIHEASMESHRFDWGFRDILFMTLEKKGHCQTNNNIIIQSLEL